MAAHTFTAEIAYRLGRGARCIDRGWTHCEHHFVGWIVVRGLAPSAAQLLLDVTKFAALGAFFFIASWFAALVAFAVAASWVAASTAAMHDEEKAEWRYGLMGYGLYHPDGTRIDPYDPDEEF